MSTKVVSTKLTEEEHAKLLDACNKQGCNPSHLIKEAILEKIGLKESDDKEKEIVPSELRKLLSIRKG